VAGYGADFGVAGADRAQEGDLDRLTDADHPVVVDGDGGGVGAEALDQARVDAAVEDPVGLAQLVADGDPGAGVVGLELDPLGTDVGVEVGGRNLTGLRHRRGPYIGCPGWR
jgi:hypothetical protein